MPTAARFVAGVFFAALAWYVSGLIVPLFPENTNLGYFTEVNAALSFLCGWSIAGPRGGTGYIAAWSYGLTTVVAMTALCLFFHSAYTMIEFSLRKRYDGATEAVVAVFELFAEHGLMILQADIVGTLLAGGVIGGLVTEFVGRRYS